MSDTTPINLRAGTSSAAQQSSSSIALSSLSVEVRNVPNDLRLLLLEDKSQTVRVRGEVEQVENRARNDTAQNSETNIRVRTDSGDVMLKAETPVNTSSNAASSSAVYSPLPALQTGQSVVLEISGFDPYAATPTKGIISYLPQNTQGNEEASPAPVRTTDTPIDVRVVATPNTSQDDGAQKLPNGLPSNLPGPETVIRLQPVAQNEVAQLIADTTIREIVQQTVTPQTAVIAPQPELSQNPVVNNEQPPAFQVRAAILTALSRPQAIPSPQAVPLQPSIPSDVIKPPEISVRPLPDASTGSQQRVHITAESFQSILPPASLQVSTELPVQGVEIARPAQGPDIQDITGRIVYSTPPAVTLVPAFETSSSVSQPDAPAPALPLSYLVPQQVQQSSVSFQAEIVAHTPEGYPVLQSVSSAPASLSTSQPSTPSAPAQTGQPAQTITPPTPQTPQHFILHVPAPDLPVGMRLEIVPQPISTTQPVTATAEMNTPIVSPALATMPWPVMGDIHQALMQMTQNPNVAIAAQAQKAVQNFTASIPAPTNPAQFGAATLFFVAAMRGGEMSGWLGEKTVELLRRAGGGDLITRLNGEASMMSRADAPSSPQEWRALNIPLFYQGEIQKAQLHYKHEREAESDEQAGGIKGTRFVFDLKFDAVGKIQLDGYFKGQNSDEKRLDVILRSEQNFSANMHQEMRGLYASALRSTGITGELSFQNEADGWVTISAAHNASLGVEA